MDSPDTKLDVALNETLREWESRRPEIVEQIKMYGGQYVVMASDRKSILDSDADGVKLMERCITNGYRGAICYMPTFDELREKLMADLRKITQDVGGEQP